MAKLEFIHNEKHKVILTTGRHMAHVEGCGGNYYCVVCGRRMCRRCWSYSFGEPTCLICSRSYQPNEILLFNEDE